MNKICIISSHGGHFYEAINATKKVIGNKYFVTHKTLGTSSILKNKKHYYILDPHTSKLKYIINFFESFKHLLIEKPSIIISTGAGISISTIILGKYLLKSKIIFIDTAASVSDLSKTGKFVYKISDLFLIQWEHLKKKYPKAIYCGLI